jgi:hypothetical protein
VRRILTFPVVIVAWHIAQTAAAMADACVADKHDGLVCGEGGSAVRVIADSISPSKAYAFAWRTPGGLPAAQEIPEGVENVLIRLSDGAVLTKLGGQYWKTGDMRRNRYDQVVAWSPDSKAVVEVANSRWDSDSFAYYLLDGEKVTKVGLRALVEPVLKAGIPAKQRSDYAFRVREDKPVTLDALGHVSFMVMVYRPKSEESRDYKMRVDITSRHGKPTARIAWMRRVKPN